MNKNTNINKINWPYYDDSTIKKVGNVLKSGKVNQWTGNEIKEFEKEYSKYFNKKYSIAVANGTLALQASLIALNLNRGDEIIVTSRSFIVSASCVNLVGLIPVFADINLNSQNIELDNIKKVITRKTKAIICVHLSGYPTDMKPIVKFAKNNNLFILEDCSQAHGAKINNTHVGNFSDIAIWSFCQDKIISTGGEGAMISCNSKSLFEKIFSYRDHGKNFKKLTNNKNKNKFIYLHDDIGSNYRMTEMQGAIGRIQLKKLDSWISKRNYNAKFIINKISKYKNLIYFSEEKKGFLNSFYRLFFYINVSNLKLNWDRDKLLKELNQNQFLFFMGSCPEIYLEKFMKKYAPKKRLKNAENLGKITFCTNIHPYQNKNHLELIVNSLKEVIDRASLY